MKTVRSLTSSQSSWRNYKLQAAYQKPIVQVSTTLVLTVFAIIFFAAFAIRPTLTTIAELVKKIEDQTEVAEKLDKKSTALATAQSEYLLVEETLPLVSAAIPPTHSLNTLLKQIEGVAAQLNLPLEGIQVESISFPDEAQTSQIGTVVELPVVVSLSASYSQIREFIEVVSQMQRLVRVETLSFSKDASLSSDAFLRMNVHMKTYYLPIESE